MRIADHAEITGMMPKVGGVVRGKDPSAARTRVSQCRLAGAGWTAKQHAAPVAAYAGRVYGSRIGSRDEDKSDRLKEVVAGIAAVLQCILCEPGECETCVEIAHGMVLRIRDHGNQMLLA